MSIQPSIWTSLGDLSIGWGLTYLVHSTLLLTTAWMAGRWLARHSFAIRETLWKLALGGGLVTATLQIGLGFEPLTASWNLAASRPAATPETGLGEPVPAPGGATRSRETVPASRSLSPLQADFELKTSGLSPRPQGRRPSSAAGSSMLRPGWGWLGVLWLAGALPLCLGLVVSHLRLRRRLEGRRDITDGPLVRCLHNLVEAAGRGRGPIRLTSSSRISVPLARGVRRREICVPTRFLTRLDPAEQETVLAHELAHLVRRDPAWLLLGRLVESLLFFQPLNRLARLRLQEIAEYRCDDWTVEKTGRALTLARCLAEVAGWSLGRRDALLAPSLAAGGSRLGQRVRRLLDRRDLTFAPPPHWLIPLAVGVLAVTVIAAPGVSHIGAQVDEKPQTVHPETTPSDSERPPAPSPPQQAPSPLAPDTAVTPLAPNTVAPALPSAPLRPVLAQPAAVPLPSVAVQGVVKPRLSFSGSLIGVGVPGAAVVSPRVAASPVPHPALRPAFGVVSEPLVAVATLSAPTTLALQAQGQEQKPGQDPEVEVAQEEIEEQLEELEEQLEEIGEELEEAIEEEIEGELEALEEVMEEEMEALEEQIEAEMEPLEEELESEMEAFEAQVEVLERELGQELDPAEVQAIVHEVMATEMESVSRAMAELGTLLGEKLGKGFDTGFGDYHQRLEPLIREITLTAQEQARVAELTVQAAELERRIERGEASQQDLDQLREEARRIARQARPRAEELARLREEARKIAAEFRPKREELTRLRDEVRGAMEEWRARFRDDIEEFRKRRGEIRERLQTRLEELRQRHEERNSRRERER